MLEAPSGEVIAYEVKAAETVRSEDFRGIQRLARRLGDQLTAGIVLYAGGQPLPSETGSARLANISSMDTWCRCERRVRPSSPKSLQGVSNDPCRHYHLLVPLPLVSRSLRIRAAIALEHALQLARAETAHAYPAPDRSELPTTLRLPPHRQRELLVLRYHLDLDATNCTSTLGIAPSAVQ